MPVQFSREEESAFEAPTREAGSDQSEVLAGTMAGLRTAGIWLAIGVVLLFIIVALMRPAIVAADSLRKNPSDVREAMMPVILFGLLGGGIGCLFGWRVSGGGGASGSLGFAIGAVAMIALIVIGALFGAILFQPEIPTLYWYCLVLMAVGGLVGVRLLTVWLA